MKPEHEIVHQGYKPQLVESHELNLSYLHHQLNHRNAKLILDEVSVDLGICDQFFRY